jgi:hypothetical protein
MKHQINGVGGVLVITLHQPGSEVSQLIDDLLLLGYGGSPVFMGPWAAALNYFTGHLGKTPQLIPGKTRKNWSPNNCRHGADSDITTAVAAMDTVRT